ncbi:MAG: PucR family transcriptional regulator ligand-binding domain-containing protein [Solirubrobacteraceae bacterium]|nr:PucR family transcriptional regulator ligand-binding domain-containing protein [Solirubrobacteraceae bacterium]
MSSVTPFALGDLLDQHELGLEQLTGSADDRARRVSGVHSIEIEYPTRWLAPDWVMLTTGVRLRGRPEDQRLLVRELAARGTAALGFARDVVFKRAPEALLDEARATGLPVFTVPLETPFRDIVAFVQRSLLSSDMRALQRLSSMQRYLIDALHSRDPQTAVVERLATLLDSSVAVLGPRGELEKAIGELPGELAGALDLETSGVQQIELADGWVAIATPVAGEQPLSGRWLVAAFRSRRAVNRLTKPIVQAAAPLVSAIGHLEDALVAQDHALRATLVGELLRPTGRDEPALVARAKGLGVSLEGPHQVAVVSPTDPAVSLDAADEALAERLSRSAVPHLVGRDRGFVALVLPPVSTQVAELLADALDAVGGSACGVGRVAAELAELPSSAADAHVASRLARERGLRVQRFEDLDLPTLVVGHVAIDRVAPAVDEILSVINARPSVREGLDAWFASDLDVAAAAAALRLHPNSLRYRLQRLADGLGLPLRAPGTIVTLYLALALERRRGAGG